MGRVEPWQNAAVPASTIAAPPLTLPATRLRALTVQAALLLAAATLLPSLAHLTGLPVRVLLPMHWPVLLVGLCYGWRSGLLVGAAAPLTSTLLSGMPPWPVLPPMTAELAAYGCLAGAVREVLGRGRLEATLAAVLVGRLVFVAVLLATGALVGAVDVYVRSAFVPGIVAAAAQVLLLPPLAAWWVRREQRADVSR